MFAEEHHSQGNYFWLFSGDNHNIGFADDVPRTKLTGSNLGEQLIRSRESFQGFAQSLPAIGDEIDYAPFGCVPLLNCVYARKHVPWISFSSFPASCNTRFADFPSDYNQLPTVAFVIPDLDHDMHNGDSKYSIPAGDMWLFLNLDGYYQWAKTHNSLLIITFDEDSNESWWNQGLTDPAAGENRIPTIFAGAGVKPGGVESAFTHVNLLRTIEAMYGLPKSGRQQPHATRAGIGDDTIITGVFKAGSRVLRQPFQWKENCGAPR